MWGIVKSEPGARSGPSGRRRRQHVSLALEKYIMTALQSHFPPYKGRRRLAQRRASLRRPFFPSPPSVPNNQSLPFKRHDRR
jgi:hypothetical protein